MVHKWWNVFRSRWGMKEPIKRLLGSGFGSVSTQCYPSVQQHRGELSVFICPRHTNWLRAGGRRFDLNNTKIQSKIYRDSGRCQICLFFPLRSQRTPLDCFSQFIKNWGTWGSVSNLQVLGPTVERLLWLAKTVLTPKLQPLLQEIVPHF